MYLKCQKHGRVEADSLESLEAAILYGTRNSEGVDEGIFPQQLCLWII